MDRRMIPLIGFVRGIQGVINSLARWRVFLESSPANTLLVADQLGKESSVSSSSAAASWSCSADRTWRIFVSY